MKSQGLDALLAVLNPTEQEYFGKLMWVASQSQSPEDFADTTKAVLALLTEGEIRFTLHGATDDDVRRVRARLSPEQNARLILEVKP